MSGYIARLTRDLAVGDALPPFGDAGSPQVSGLCQTMLPSATTHHPLGDRASRWQWCSGLSSAEDHSLVGESVG